MSKQTYISLNYYFVHICESIGITVTFFTYTLVSHDCLYSMLYLCFGAYIRKRETRSAKHIEHVS